MLLEIYSIHSLKTEVVCVSDKEGFQNPYQGNFILFFIIFPNLCNLNLSLWKQSANNAQSFDSFVDTKLWAALYSELTKLMGEIMKHSLDLDAGLKHISKMKETNLILLIFHNSLEGMLH